MSDFEDKDFDVLFGKTHKVEILSGKLKGSIVMGLWTTNHLQRNLGGVPIATSGPVLTIPSKSVDGLSSNDLIGFEGKSWSISRISKDASGLTRIEFLEEFEHSEDQGVLADTEPAAPYPSIKKPMKKKVKIDRGKLE